MQLKKQVYKKIVSLEHMLQKIEKFLEKAPEGSLKWQYKNGKIYYYQQYLENCSDQWKRRYIKKQNIELAQLLAQKQYYLLAKPVVEKQLKRLKNFIGIYSDDELTNVYEALSEERKYLVVPLKRSLKQKIETWKNEQYEANTKYPENLRYDTEQGEKVRSKSEVIIANLLYQKQKNLLYKYERPLQFVIDGQVKVFYPDFTILNVKTGKIVYWEHAGRMDDSYYVNDFIRKINLYINHGMLPGQDFVVSYETQNCPLDITAVKQMIKNIAFYGI